MRLKDKVVLITGSSSGIGAALAKGMAAEGAKVIINFNRNEKGAQAVAKAIMEMGREALIIQADVGDNAAVLNMFQRIQNEFGHLDVLINNAGITLKKPFLECDENDWDRILNANLKSVFLCSRQTVNLMHEGGVILNISSDHAMNTISNFSIYAASKGGLESLTRSMALELGTRGIRVNALRLGWIQVERDHIDPKDTVYKAICERIPIGRAGKVEDVIPTAIHLCSAETGFMTGQVVILNGGHNIVLNTPFSKGYESEGARTD